MLIIAGHLVLGNFTQHALYLGLTLIILGIGLFKSNAICLIGNCYKNDPAGKSAAFSWYYVSGNVGAIISQILCPYIAQEISWSAGFLLAAIGMMLGLVMLILARPYFAEQSEQIPNIYWKSLSKFFKTTITLTMLLIAILICNSVLQHNLVGNLLVVICFISAGMFIQIYRRALPEQKKSLFTIAMLTLFATGFWIFDQQGSSSVSLFIHDL